MNFKLVRNISVYIFASSIALVSLIGILSIWEFFSSDVLTKSLTTLLILSIGFVLIVLTTFEREGRFTFLRQKNKEFSVIRIIGYIILAYLCFNVFMTLVF
ncbi:MAG: hypothetical protein WDZ73_01225 [Candidatus Paceibacterota bacterium]